MMLRIDSDEFNALLQRRRDAIGFGPVLANCANLIAGLFYIPAALTAGTTVLQILYGVIAVLFVIVGGYNTVCSLRHRYTADDLFEDVRTMHRPLIRSSIIAITDGEGSNRYLLYRDVTWGCDFFPNRRATGNVDDDMASAIRYLSTEFGIPESEIVLKPVGMAESTKYSTEHHEYRDYVYQLYRAHLDTVPESWSGDRFRVLDKDCRWMTLNEMLADRNINEINHDVVSLVRQSA